jgi:hypothetical protein
MYVCYINTTQRTTMASFSDSDKFMFVAQGDGSLTPVHYRELGQKEGYLYSKKVSWADATINNVPLEQTFRYEDEIEYIRNTSNVSPGSYIVVNERPSQSISTEEDILGIHHKKKWLNRLYKMTLKPMTLPQAKKKKGHQRFPIKPKTEVQKETEHHSYDKFQELIDTKSPGILGSFIYKIQYKDGYEENVSWDDGDDRGFNVKKEVRLIPKYKERTYCPPEHWLTPEIKWKNIWLEMDEIEHGYNRDYVYVPEGELCPDSASIMGPAIYFFETPYDNIEEYEKAWVKANKYWITGNLHNNHTHRWLEINDSSRLSDTSYLERVEKEYLKNPSEETLNNYQDGWRLTQPGYEGYYRSSVPHGGYGWIFKIFPSKKGESVPHPHL